MKPKIEQNTEQAQIIALKALGFLAGDEDRLSYFLLTTGMDLNDLKHNASEPLMLAGLLDHLLQNESLLLDFAASADISPETIVRARLKLPGATYDS